MWYEKVHKVTKKKVYNCRRAFSSIDWLSTCSRCFLLFIYALNYTHYFHLHLSQSSICSSFNLYHSLFPSMSLVFLFPLKTSSLLKKQYCQYGFWIWHILEDVMPHILITTHVHFKGENNFVQNLWGAYCYTSARTERKNTHQWISLVKGIS